MITPDTIATAIEMARARWCEYNRPFPYPADSAFSDGWIWTPFFGAHAASLTPAVARLSEVNSAATVEWIGWAKDSRLSTNQLANPVVGAPYVVVTRFHDDGSVTEGLIVPIRYSLPNGRFVYLDQRLANLVAGYELCAGEMHMVCAYSDGVPVAICMALRFDAEDFVPATEDAR